MLRCIDDLAITIPKYRIIMINPKVANNRASFKYCFPVNHVSSTNMINPEMANGITIAAVKSVHLFRSAARPPRVRNMRMPRTR